MGPGKLKGANMGNMAIDSVYDRMPLDRVRADALHGVSAAREAYRERDPVHADIDLGPTISPAEQAEYRNRVMSAIAVYQRGHRARARNG